jgi:LacI family transcriptional regulator
MPKKEVTIYDIAKALNVSGATVSRGLKNHSSISKKTCEKIKQTALEMGYRSNALASSLRTSRSFTLGVIVPRLNSNFMSTVLAGMERAAVEKGYHLIIMQSFESEEKEKECTQLLFNHRVDGLLVSTSSESQGVKHFSPFFQKNIPVVFFDRAPIANHFFNSLPIDNKGAGYALTRQLLENDSQDLLHITGNTNLLVYQQRLNGFKQALAEFNKPYNPEMVWATGLGVEDGEIAAEKILKMKKLPDAIFVSNDTCAIAIIHHLQKNGIKIPEQVQVAGFNNDPFSALLTPGLTTVKYPGTEMGIKAVQATIDLISNKPDNPIQKQLDFQLIIRESTKIKNKVL